MKKLIAITLLICMTALAAACANESDTQSYIPDGGDTPVREVLDEVSSARFVWTAQLGIEGGLVSETVDEKVSYADITILGWLDESYDSSCFSAEVNRTIAGEALPDRIVAVQFGSSELYSRQSLLYKKGDRLLVPLTWYDDDSAALLADNIREHTKKDSGDWIKSGSVYGVLATCDCDIVELDGETYVLDRYGAFTEHVKSDAKAVETDDDTFGALKSVLFEDALLKAHEELLYPNGAFLYEDIVELITEYYEGA